MENTRSDRLRWEKNVVDKQLVRSIAKRYSCDLLTAHILVNREITADNEIPYFLDDGLHLLHDPVLLPGMNEAVRRILHAKSTHEKVLVFGDRDVDGITATVLLTDYLRSLGMDISWRVPIGDEPYGLSMKVIEDFAATGGTLVITVDCGIANNEEISLAHELGIAVIITDHHEPKDSLPAALVMVNPKLPYSTYPFRDIAGCVVAYKLVSALQRTRPSPGFPDYVIQNENGYLQLAALGTVADMVPLRNENRLIVRRGLNALIHKPRYGLSELLLILGLSGKKITAEELSWILCPAINAAGRMGAPDKAVALLLETDPLQRLSLAGELKAMNEKRKRLGAKTGPFVERLATESIARFDNKLVVAAGEAINRGITGVMANRLIDRFHIPAMAVCLGEELAIGSIRSPGNYNIRLLLEPLDDLLLNYGGHANALGFRVRRSLWDQFLDRLEIELAYIDCVSIPEHTAVTVDAELPQSYLTPDLLTLVDRFAPYGTGNEPLVFYSRNLPVISITLMGKREPKHAKFIPDTGRHKWPAIFWKVPEQVRQTINVGDTVDVRYTLNRDCYRGLEIPQIIIKDIGVRSGFP